VRQIGSISNREQAELFAAYLTAQGTSCSIKPAEAGQVVWIENEDQVEKARDEIQQFLSEPDHERYRNAKQLAASVNREREKKVSVARQQVVDLRDRWSQPTIAQCPVTACLILVMIVVGFATGFDPKRHMEIYRTLVFSWDEVVSGEVWRLVTPVFLHFDVFHFLFNFICLRELGFLTEYRLGSPRFLAMVVTFAALSDGAQYLVTGPGSGGMSGVNYGLFGYIWVRGKLEPESGFWVSQITVFLMMGWLVFCVLFPQMQVGNWSHGTGLAIGALLGASKSLWNGLIGRR
jgi:GlpG protein